MRSRIYRNLTYPEESIAILESLSFPTVEECRNRYQSVIMAKSRIIISGYLEDEYIGIKRKEHDDKVEPY